MASFEDVSVTQRFRIMGDDVRLLRCYSGDWQVWNLSQLYTFQKCLR